MPGTERVLVFGATGEIGGRIARGLCRLRPQRDRCHARQEYSPDSRSGPHRSGTHGQSVRVSGAEYEEGSP